MHATRPKALMVSAAVASAASLGFLGALFSANSTAEIAKGAAVMGAAASAVVAVALAVASGRSPVLSS